MWWAWGTYAWLTNTVDPEEGAVRLAVFAAAAAMLVVALATPGAFGAEAVAFGIAYFLVRALHLVLFAIAARDDPELRRPVLRWAPGAFLGPSLLAAPVSSTGRQTSLCGPPRWPLGPSPALVRHGS